MLETLKFTEFKPNTAASGVAERRRKLAAKIEEQLKLAMDGSFQPMKQIWTTGEDGVRRQQERAKRVKRWWLEGTDGTVLLTVRYGSKPIEFAKGKNAIQLTSKAEVEGTLRNLKLAVLAGEFDSLVADQVKRMARKSVIKQ
jgi:hypothetical protein